MAPRRVGRRLVRVAVDRRVALGLGCAAVMAAAAWAMRGKAPVVHAANAADIAEVVAGHAVYARACAMCHGRRLQGQPLWQVVDADSWRRAPALDATGHSWLRSDEALFRVVKYGVATGGLAQAGSAGGGAIDGGAKHDRSGMPAFEGRLSDAEILSALAYVKARWPAALSIVQAGLNPAGGRSDMGGAHWTFPAFCRPGL